MFCNEWHKAVYIISLRGQSSSPPPPPFPRRGIVHSIEKKHKLCTVWVIMSLPEPVFVNVWGAQESIPPAYVARRACTIVRAILPEPVFVDLLRSPGIDSQHGEPVRQPYFSYRPAMLHRLPESIHRNRFLGSINLYKYELWLYLCRRNRFLRIDSWAP